VAVAEAVAQVVDPRRVEVKWPNDVLVDGRKVSGILAELETRKDGIEWVVMGVGVNVNPPEGSLGGELEKRAISLGSVAESRVKRKALRGDILERLQLGLKAFEKRAGKLDPTDWLRWSGDGRRVWFGEGEARLQGVAMGITSEGALRITAMDGTDHVVVAGDVTPVSWEG
jgi:BirA family biotin operon repressor/biotin-[acetyl-CoA-carboxylase] ligase